MRRLGRICVLVLVSGALVASWSVPFCAAGEKEPATAGSRYAAQVRQALGFLVEKYGVDAVNLQGNLLRYAIDNGSLLEASVSISGIEERDGFPYLVLRLDTGMVLPDKAVPAAARPARIWKAVVEPSLRHCTSLDVRAEGVEIQTRYRHSESVDRTDLAARVRANSVPQEAATFRFRKADVVEMARKHIRPEELLARGWILVDGRPHTLSITPKAGAPAQ